MSCSDLSLVESAVCDKVLAIDDSPEVIGQIRGVLQGSVTLLAANSGEAGLKVAQKQQPDLILLDVLMPGMDGYAVCRALKADLGTKNIPVIFVTGLDQEGDELKGFAAGAVDFVTKPIEPVVLRARVRAQLDLARAHSALSAVNRRLATERELIAETINNMRLAYPFSCEFLSYSSHSCGEASGDLVFSAACPNGDRYALLGDFTGHGLPAAIGTPIVSYPFYSMAAEGRPLQDILITINDLLVRQLPLNIFMVGVGLQILPALRQVRIWSFGAPDVLHRTGSGWSHVESAELPLGIVLSQGYFAYSTFSLEIAESLFVFTDGAIETETAEGGFFGIERLKTTIEKEGEDIGKVVAQVLSSASGLADLDDITLMRVGFEGPLACQEVQGVIDAEG